MTVELTPDQLIDARTALPYGMVDRYFFVADNGVHFTIVGRVPGALIVRGSHGQYGLATVTGRAIRSRMVRGRIVFANDHGYGDGRITFDGDSIGGRLPVDAALAVTSRV